MHKSGSPMRVSGSFAYTVQSAEWAQAVEWEFAYLRYGSPQHYSAWIPFLSRLAQAGCLSILQAFPGNLACFWG